MSSRITHCSALHGRNPLTALPPRASPAIRDETKISRRCWPLKHLIQCQLLSCPGRTRTRGKSFTFVFPDLVGGRIVSKSLQSFSSPRFQPLKSLKTQEKRARVQTGCGIWLARSTLRPGRTCPRKEEIENKAVGILLEQRDPRESLDGVAALFERNGDAYPRRHFEWYLSQNGYGMPITWLLRTVAHHDLVGFCCVMPRQFRWGTMQLEAGVVGNILVDKGERKSLGAINVISATRSLVSRRQVDFLLSITDGSGVQTLDCRMGCQIVGQWEPQSLIFHSAALLRSQFGWLGVPLSPALDLWAGTRRLFTRCPTANFQVVELTAAGIHRLPVETWTPPERRFVHQPSIGFVQHYLTAPLQQYRALGLVDPHSNDVCGYMVVTVNSGRVNICDCATDANRLGQAEAVWHVCRQWKHNGEIFTVTTLRSSELSRELQELGFLPLRPFRRRLGKTLLGLWRPDHPLVQELANPSHWNLFLEANYV